MLREDCVEMFEKIPEPMHPQVNLVLRNGFCLSVSMVARFEESYVVFSGREGGTSDEGRAFFVPYDEISYVRIERAVRVGELKRMFGETGYEDMEDRFDALAAQGEKKPDGASPVANTAPVPAVNGTPMMASDPAAIARQNLLDRIRAARANVAGTTSSKMR